MGADGVGGGLHPPERVRKNTIVKHSRGPNRGGGKSPSLRGPECRSRLHRLCRASEARCPCDGQVRAEDAGGGRWRDRCHES